jgi:hypothetical protein
MRSQQVTTSAALFCAPVADHALLQKWFANAIEFFSENRLSPILFTASGGGFELDDCHVLANPGGDLVMFGERIARGRAPPGARRIRQGIQAGAGPRWRQDMGSIRKRRFQCWCTC